MLWIFSCSGEHDVKRPACAIRVRRQSKRSTILAVFALGFLPALIFDAPAAIAAEDRLVRAAFFSDECKEADARGIMQTSDANALLAAFATFRRNLPAPAASNPDEYAIRRLQNAGDHAGQSAEAQRHRG